MDTGDNFRCSVDNPPKWLLDIFKFTERQSKNFKFSFGTWEAAPNWVKESIKPKPDLEVIEVITFAFKCHSCNYKMTGSYLKYDEALNTSRRHKCSV